MHVAPSSAKSDALKFTCAFTRRHPSLAAWQHDADTAHQAVLTQWRAHPAVALYLSGHERRADNLLRAGRAFIASERDLVGAAWEYITGTAEWLALPASARHLAEVLFARGGEHGPNVPLCHDLAIEMIFNRFGLRYSKATITQARERLTGAGFVTADVGQPWTPGVRSLPTVYHLLGTLREQAAALLSTGELCPSALLAGERHSSPKTGVPRLTDRERALMLLKIEELRAARQREEWIWGSRGRLSSWH